ncbi:poly(glycerol-phosphate) alpha-glucosyltransferase, partial [Escherichia coli]|nr:poly(glycerol-phosphate) alpha-glucosyltransferase [Escherichia coli]
TNKNQAQLNLTVDSTIVTFNTVGWFFDGKKIHELEPSELEHGRRSTKQLTPDAVFELVGNAGNYLVSQVNQTGEF